MNPHTSLTKAFVASVLALAGAAHAQDNTGADRPTTAPATASSGAQANGVYPAPTQGVEQGVPASKNAHATRTTRASRHKPHHAESPANGSDGKGQ